MWVQIRIPKGIIEIHPTYVTQLTQRQRNNDSVPPRLEVADVLVNYGKDVSFTRNGFIKSPFIDEEKEDT